MSKILVDKGVLEQALEALESFMHDSPRPYDAMRGQAAMEAIRAALAEPVQEPVAWIQPDHLQKARVAPFLCRVEPTQRCSDFVALYSAPPQRKPLTEEQKLDLVTNWFSEDWAIKNALGLLDDCDIECARVLGE